MRLQSTPIPGLTIIESSRSADDRGSFCRLYCDRELEPLLDGGRIVQINHSVTNRVGAIRGLHFQHPPAAEIKIVRCMRGEVFDVAVDLRAGSTTFLNWFGVVLCADDDRAIAIPAGFAHGFQVLEPGSELLYLHSAHYNPELEDGLRYDEPKIGIEWPLEVSEVSERDNSHAPLTGDFAGISL